MISEIFALVDGLDEPTSKYIYEEMQKILKEEEEKSKRFEALKAEIMKLKGKIFSIKAWNKFSAILKIMYSIGSHKNFPQILK